MFVVIWRTVCRWKLRLLRDKILVCVVLLGNGNIVVEAEALKPGHLEYRMQRIHRIQRIYGVTGTEACAAHRRRPRVGDGWGRSIAAIIEQ